MAAAAGFLNIEKEQQTARAFAAPPGPARWLWHARAAEAAGGQLVHIDLRGGVGIGDWLMISPALAAYRRQHPHDRILVHSHRQAEEVFRFNSDVASVYLTPQSHELGPGLVIPMGQALGKEGTTRWAFRLMGMTGEGQISDRRLRLTLLPAEQIAAAALLRERLRLDPSRWILALQSHGSWISKRWRYLVEFARKAVSEAGAQILLLGSRNETPIDVFGPGVVDLRMRTPLRVAFTLIGLADTFVGFDSGLTLAAIALRTPAVGMVGSHNPRWLLGDAQGSNVVLLRKRTPAMCKTHLGVSCREDGRYGDYCPLRGVSPDRRHARPGADCIDDIYPEEVLAEALALPRLWNHRPFEERRLLCLHPMP